LNKYNAMQHIQAAAKTHSAAMARRHSVRLGTHRLLLLLDAIALVRDLKGARSAEDKESLTKTSLATQRRSRCGGLVDLDEGSLDL